MSASLQQDDDRVIYALIRSMYDADGAIPSRREWERLRRAAQRRRIHFGFRIAICAGALAVTVISTGRPSLAPAPVAEPVSEIAVLPAPVAVTPVAVTPVASPSPVATPAPVRVARADPAAARRWRARVRAWRAKARARRVLAAEAPAIPVEAVVPAAPVAMAGTMPAVMENRRPMTVASVRSTLPVQESDRRPGEDSSDDANRATPATPDHREKEALDAIRTLRLR